MASVMVIVSKAVFEKAAGKSPEVGDRLHMDRYVTANKALEPVKGGGKLYLVTVRPPDEALWLVAVLENPKFDGKQWTAAPADTAITDISALRSKIKFESGKGMSAAKGTLGMSLQTPRTLSDKDVELLDAALGIAPAAKPLPKQGVPAAPEQPVAANTAERDRGDALRQAVLDDPTSDLAKQVYADAFMARNDPRGELIQVELALDGPLSIKNRADLTARRDELLKAHAKEWFPYGGFETHRHHGGFLAMVGGTLGKLLKATAVFDNEPIVEVHVRDVDDANVKKLLAAPWLARIRHLVVKGRLLDKGFTALVGAPNVQQLENLNVIGHGITAAGLASLNANLPACHTLVLTKNFFGNAGVEALRNWHHLANLEVLYLSNCNITPAGVEALLAAPLPKLVKLTLSNNSLDDTIGAVLAKRAGNLPALEHVELLNAKLTTKALDTLGKLPLPKLRRLDVRKNRIKPADVAGQPVFRAGLA